MAPPVARRLRDTHRVVQLRFLTGHRVPHVAGGEDRGVPGHSLGSRRRSEVPLLHRHPGRTPDASAAPGPGRAQCQVPSAPASHRPSWGQGGAAANGQEEERQEEVEEREEKLEEELRRGGGRGRMGRVMGGRREQPSQCRGAGVPSFRARAAPVAAAATSC